ncbi:unnamed protein product [Brassica rapa subsp. trilocularis]
MSFFKAQMCIVSSKNNQSFGSPRFTAERRPVEEQSPPRSEGN